MHWSSGLSCGLVVAAGLATLGGCTTSSSVPHAASPIVGVVYSGPFQADAVYFSGKVELASPGATRPKLTWQQAVAKCAPETCDGLTNTTISLALATTPQTGTFRTDGTTKPATDSVLSYVVISQHQLCYSSGGAAPGPGRPASTQTTAHCDKIELLDANTGRLEYDAYGKK